MRCYIVIYSYLSSLLVHVTNLAAKICPPSFLRHFITRPNFPLNDFRKIWAFIICFSSIYIIVSFSLSLFLYIFLYVLLNFFKLPVCLGSFMCLSVSLYFYLYVCIFMCLSVCLSICLFGCLFICRSVLLVVCLTVFSVYPSFCLSIYLCSYLSVSLFICLPDYMSTCLMSICLSTPYISFCLSYYLFINMYIYLSTCPSVPVYLYVYLSIYLSTHLPISLSISKTARTSFCRLSVTFLWWNAHSGSENKILILIFEQ